MDSPVIPLSQLSESIVRTLAYYDLFDHPLTSSEIFTYLPTNHVTPGDVEAELTLLKERGLIYRFGNFYSLQNNAHLEKRRVNGNVMAEKFLAIAVRKAKLISHFPFVRSVMISGSLSKGYADSQSDIDFFIVTSPGRLWITRILLVLYKRLFLLNSNKYFCTNYLLDSEHLEIEERNLYTATELATLIPMCGKRYHHELLKRNEWLSFYFPNYRSENKIDVSPKDSGFKKACEWILNRCFPNLLDRYFMNLTLRRWQKKYGRHYASPDFNIAFKTQRHVSKSHPKNYQRHVVLQYEAKLETYKTYFVTNSAA